MSNDVGATIEPLVGVSRTLLQAKASAGEGMSQFSHNVGLTTNIPDDIKKMIQ